MKIECIKQESNNKLVLTTYSENVVGYLVFTQNKNEIEILDIFIDKNLRNLGNGSKLVNYIVEYAKNVGVNTVIFKKHIQMNNFLLKNMFVKNDSNCYILTNLKKEYTKRIKVKNVIYSMILINIILVSIKVMIGYISKLDIFYFEAINSTSDMLSLLLSVYGIYVGSKLFTNLDKKPIGNGKINLILSIVISVFVLFAIFKLLIEEIFNRTNVVVQKSAVYVSIILLVIKIFQFIYLRYENKKLNNTLLKGIELDYKNDIVLSIATSISLVISIYIKYNITIILAIIFSIYIIPETIKFLNEKVKMLLDFQDTKLLKEIKIYIVTNYKISTVHDMYMIHLGDYINVYADIRFDNEMSVAKAHEISEEISLDIQRKYKNINKVTFHIEPKY